MNKFLVLVIFCIFPLSLVCSDAQLLFKSKVVSAIKKKVPIMKKCYQDAVDSDGEVRSKVVNFVIKIDPEGYLSQIYVANSFHMGVLRCVNSNIAGLDFGATPDKKPFTIQIPINFRLNRN